MIKMSTLNSTIPVNSSATCDANLTLVLLETSTMLLLISVGITFKYDSDDDGGKVGGKGVVTVGVVT
jgi:hypothetical protein